MNNVKVNIKLKGFHIQVVHTGSMRYQTIIQEGNAAVREAGNATFSNISQAFAYANEMANGYRAYLSAGGTN